MTQQSLKSEISLALIQPDDGSDLYDSLDITMTRETNKSLIDHDDNDKPISKRLKMLYISVTFLYIIVYILLFVQSTVVVSAAKHIILCISLALSLIFTMKPSYISMPCSKKIHFPLDQSTVPIICIIWLVISGTEDFSIQYVWDAVKGQAIRPWEVLGVLFGLCYLSISLDGTGILRALAKKTVIASHGSSMRLFLYIFLFAAIVTACTNNDISIICLTPLVISTANEGKIDSTPFVYMVLFASNTFSMLLVTGNPANLMVQQAAKLNYITYLKYMAAPTIFTGIMLFAEIYIMFKNSLKVNMKQFDSTNDWTKLIKFPKYAIFCIIRLAIACLGIPIGNALYEEELEGHIDIDHFPVDMVVVLGVTLIAFIIDIIKMRELAIETLIELPWKLIPFVLSLFVIVRFMEQIGLVGELANILIGVSMGNIWITMFVVGFTAVFLCQCVNNQPMTVLISTVLTHASRCSGETDDMSSECLSGDVLTGAYFALAIGANLGGNGTPVASLAVLIWRSILEKWNIFIEYFVFSKRGLSITPLLLIGGIMVVIIEIDVLKI